MPVGYSRSESLDGNHCRWNGKRIESQTFGRIFIFSRSSHDGRCNIARLLKGDATWATGHNVFLLLVGCAVSFVVALFAMKWFVAFLTKYGFKAFGWYRIIVGGIILIMLLSGASLNMIG